MIFRRELGNVFLSGNAKEINIASSEHEKKLRRNTVSAKGTRYTARCALSVCTLGCAVGLQLSRTPWSQTQTAGGFCFQSLDLGLKLDGIFQNIVPVTLFGGEEPVKCTVSRHNTFSLSYFVFITRPPCSSKHSGACRLPWCPCLLHSLSLSFWFEDTAIDVDCYLVTWGRLKRPTLVQPALFSSLSHT